MTFQYQYGESFLHKVDPVNKLLWMLCISVLAFIYSEAMPQGILFLAVFGTAVVMAKLSVGFIVRGVWVIFLFSLGFFLMQLIFISGEEIAFSLGGFHVYKEALNFATAVTIRMLTVFITSLIFVVTTEPKDLVLSLTQHMKIPYRIAYSISVALRFIPTLESEAKVIEAAQVIRGVGKQKGLKNKVANFKRFTMPLLMGAIRRVHVTAITMEARGYGAYKQRTYTKHIEITKASLAFSIISIGATIILMVTRFI